MESDRLKDPCLPRVLRERDVVYERRLRVESTPTGKRSIMRSESIFWHSTPYTWPVIGYASDVANIIKAEADDYFGDPLRPEQPDRRSRRRLRTGPRR
ncbi:MAG: hypothetical protein IPN03_18605 [Holophagales bacterium]|nr:hypothetical protein [Holophagales bacterium]